MNKQQLLAALESIGMRPGRGLGQNFLLDGNLLDSIVRLDYAEPIRWDGVSTKEEDVYGLADGLG